MTEAEAITEARIVAAQRGYPWLEPVKAWRHRPWFYFFGRTRITVKTNANSHGGNIWAAFDEKSGELLEIGFARR